MNRRPAPRSPEARAERNYARARARRLVVEVDLEFDGRIPLADGYIVTALSDALLDMDEQGLLFPGVDWPRHRERLRDWSVSLIRSGRRTPSRRCRAALLAAAV